MRRLTRYAARQAAGDYMIASKRPTWAPVAHAGYSDWYVTPGDSFGVRGLCAGGLARMLGGTLPGENLFRVELYGGKVGDCDAPPNRPRLMLTRSRFDDRYTLDELDVAEGVEAIHLPRMCAAGIHALFAVELGRGQACRVALWAEVGK